MKATVCVCVCVRFHLSAGPNRQVSDASWEPGYKMYTNTHKYEPEKREAVGGGNKATSEDGMAWEKGGDTPQR